MQPQRRIRHSAAEPRDPVIILAWPAFVGAFTLAVLAVLWTQTTPAVALVVAAITLAAGGVLLTLLYGSSWITQLRPALSGWKRRSNGST